MKNTVLCIRYFSNTKHKSAKKKTGQCFSIELQFTCRTSDKSETNLRKIEKRPKIRHKAVLHPALQFTYAHSLISPFDIFLVSKLF